VKNLLSLLDRFKLSLGKDTLAREKVIAVIEECTNLTLSLEDISIKEDTLTICTTPARQNLICLKEEKILQQLRVTTHIKRIFYC
jgi:hypothetical protein